MQYLSEISKLITNDYIAFKQNVTFPLGTQSALHRSPIHPRPKGTFPFGRKKSGCSKGEAYNLGSEGSRNGTQSPDQPAFRHDFLVSLNS